MVPQILGNTNPGPKEPTFGHHIPRRRTRTLSHIRLRDRPGKDLLGLRRFVLFQRFRKTIGYLFEEELTFYLCPIHSDILSISTESTSKVAT